MKHIHILGICGTFMGSLALIAKEKGYRVTGSDQHVYPPMSTLLSDHGIDVMTGFEPSHLETKPDMVIIGNAMSRGNTLVEYVLNEGIPYTSGPQWLAENVLQDRWVLAVAGTHGKTTTASLLAWILEACGQEPGFLIGGVPQNFPQSARLGKSKFFVIEADEYDTAFFDKRSKCILYRPRTAILNNVEYDHADIFPDLDAIKQQFHFFIRTVPGEGAVIHNANDPEVTNVLERGCWSNKISFAGPDSDWQAELKSADGHHFAVYYQQQLQGEVTWSLLGKHNVNNALAAIAAAHHAGVQASDAIAALGQFAGIKRRLELRGKVNGISVYDDFAHHPTAIATTLDGLRQRSPQQRIIVLLECGSNTMKQGHHQQQLAPALAAADHVILLQPSDWDASAIIQQATIPMEALPDVETIVARTKQLAQPEDQIIVMSNKGFGGIHDKLLQRLA